MLAKTSEHESCQQFVVTYLHDVHDQFHRCVVESMKQSQSCPTTLAPVGALDQRLKEFICLQRRYLIKRQTSKSVNMHDLLDEHRLFRACIENSSSTAARVRTWWNGYLVFCDFFFVPQRDVMDELVHIRQVQLQCFEKLLMLEQRIRCNFLPRAFDQFERSIAPDIYWPVIDDSIAVDFTMKRHKIIQEAKRELVTIHVDAYEAKIQHYERRYEHVLNDCKLTIATSLNVHACDWLNSIVAYMNHRTHRMKNEIYGKVTRCRRNLARSRQRASSSRKNVVDVCPRVIVDVNGVPLSAGELKYLSLGPGYIRPNQTWIGLQYRQDKLIDSEQKKIMKQIIDFLTRTPMMARSSLVFKHYESYLHDCLARRYTAALPLVDQIRAHREFHTAKSIVRKLRQAKLTLRPTDKSGILHIGRASDYQHKAAIYRSKTRAYEQLTSNPSEDVFNRVVRALNNLKSSGQISEWQRVKMTPLRSNTALAYQYFLPKVHKVNKFRRLVHHRRRFSFLLSLRRERHFDPSSIRYMRRRQESRNSWMKPFDRCSIILCVAQPSSTEPICLIDSGHM